MLITNTYNIGLLLLLLLAILLLLATVFCPVAGLATIMALALLLLVTRTAGCAGAAVPRWRSAAVRCLGFAVGLAFCTAIA